MFEGIYFQFPKLGFLLFFFLACEALCPLRTNPVYFPNLPFFKHYEFKPPLWIWIAKWLMISMLIVALMSPVKEIIEEPRGYDIVMVLDPQSIDRRLKEEIRSFISGRPFDRFAFYIPSSSPVMVPLSDDHSALLRILTQLPTQLPGEKVTKNVERFFATTSEGYGWAMIFSKTPTAFVHSLPVGVEVSVIEPNESWVEVNDRSHPPFRVVAPRKYFDYYYIYSLFIGFIAMLLYLYGRNQKGMG